MFYFFQVMKSQIRGEVKGYLKKPTVLTQEFSLPNVENFSWLQTSNEIEQTMPTLQSAIEGSLTASKSQEYKVQWYSFSPHYYYTTL